LNNPVSITGSVDPATHLVLPMLLLLSARLDPKLVIPLSFFALVPDFDSVIGVHRATLHNLFVVAAVPIIFIVWAKLKDDRFVLPGLIVLFYLMSHIVLDLSGVALLYPVIPEAFYLRPSLGFHTEPSLRFDFSVEYGLEELEQSSDYLFISNLGFAYLFLLVLLGIVFRKEAFAFLCSAKNWAVENIRKFLRRPPDAQ